MSKGKIAVVAMSGGVDSSLAAALLLGEGYDVRGVSLRVFDPARCQEGDEKTCCSARDIRDARRVAAQLEIPFSSWDVREAFEEAVVRPFVRDYCEGRTPNPCVRCNSRIKFDLLLTKAKQIGADILATGHYARVGRRNGSPELRRGADRAKDQSYFLFEISRESLEGIAFPLGGMTKDQVRRLAADKGLPVAAKKESQEVCFIPDNDYGAFLQGRVGTGSPPPGPVVDAAGRRLGTHRGLMHYTIGQRRGIGIAAPEPLYVTGIDRASNSLVVGAAGELFKNSFTVRQMNWLRVRPAMPLRAEVQIRYRHRAAPAVISSARDGSCRVEFDEPQRAVTPGQAAAFYHGEILVGGGWIDEVR